METAINIDLENLRNPSLLVFSLQLRTLFPLIDPVTGYSYVLVIHVERNISILSL